MSLQSEPQTHMGRLSGLLLLVVDLVIAALIFVLPFIMGGREAWGHWFLISASMVLGLAWCAYATVSGCRYRISWFEGFLLAGAAIVWFQIQPQSADTLQNFSAEYERLLPSWSSTQSAGTAESWSTLSLTPVESSHGLWMFAAYCVILLVVFQRVRTVEDSARLIKAVAVSGLLMTGFGLLQWNTSNGKFFGFYEHPYTNARDHLKGAFTNRNHFAQFLSLSLGPLFWWLFRDLKRLLSPAEQSSTMSSTESPTRTSGSHRSRKKKKGSSGATNRQFKLSPHDADRFLSIPVLALVFCVALVGLSVMISESRGGMIAAGSASIVALIGLWRGFNFGGAMAGILLGGGILFLSLLAFTNQEQVQSRVDQLISTDAEQVDAGGPRRAIWAADGKAIQRFPLLGTGVGSHRDVYAIYMDNYADFATSEMTHAESSYVHLALEAGLIGVGCLVIALLFFLIRMLIGYLGSTSDANRSICVAVAASAAAGTLHAVTDFIWYVPGIVVVSLVLAVVGLRSASRSFGETEQPGGMWFPRIGWAVAGALCVLGLVRVQPELMSRIEGEKHWYASLRTALRVDNESDGFEDLEAGEAISLDEQPVERSLEAQAVYESEVAARESAARVRYHQKRVGHLALSLKACPDQHRVKLALAEQLLKLFDQLQVHGDNPFPLNMVRDTAINGGFQSADDVRTWLNRTFGKRTSLVLLADRLARESLALCPVQGHAYLSLMETSFVNNPNAVLNQKLIDQALLVRGHDPRVRFVAGREALMSNDREAALAMWDSVFHSNRFFRMDILGILAPQAAVEFFIQQFHPNAEELKDLADVYQALERKRDYLVVLNELCRVIPQEAPGIEDEEERLTEMMLACNAARELKNPELAIGLLQQTLTDFPESYDAHYGMGLTFYELERYPEAIQHLQWCHEWDPGNEWVPKMISWARREIHKVSDEPEARLTRL